MKKRFSHISVFVAAAALVLSLFTQRVVAVSVSADLTGTKTAQPGNTVTLTLSVSGSNIKAVSGELSYDSSTLKYVGCNLANSAWNISTEDNINILLDGVNTPINSATSLLTFSFSVKDSVATDTALRVSFSGYAADDDEKKSFSASWNGTVAAPPNNNCDLKGITVTNATLSPAFNKNTTYYTCTVPYDVQKLNLDYFRADQGQTVNISGNSNFVVGENTVTLTVKASGGATKTYTIVVTRAQDPNYKASTDAALSALCMEGVTLSPSFSPNVTEYIGYVSHETTAVKLTGAARDEKALNVTEKELTLSRDGVTDVSIVCTAEDGKTTQTYTVHVYRMPAYSGGIPVIEYTNEKDIVPEEEPIPAFSIPKTMVLPLIGEAPTTVVVGSIAAVVVILLFLLGLLIGRARRSDPWEEEEPEPPVREPVRQPIPPEKAQPKPTIQPVRPEAERPAPGKAAKPEPPASADENLDQLLKEIHDM